ncbi:MAG: nitroreductase family deazaflavin-dependent oxidoreductase [Desulfobacteraceae bacterium]|nr:nitroreductase family deazaflavin-dependent oxidoreductase [Desulfobacteraceae bacterium]
MTKAKSLSLSQRIFLLVETYLVTFLVPKHSVGKLFGFIFKIPLFFHKLGLSILIPRRVMILTTIGRRTGIPRQTPIEYSFDAEKDAFVVMSGWEGRTDWYRNARVNPVVSIWVGGEKLDAIAQPASDHEAAMILKDITLHNPRAKLMWSRWSNVDIDGSEESFLAAAPHFPVLYLRPLRKND